MSQIKVIGEVKVERFASSSYGLRDERGTEVAACGPCLIGQQRATQLALACNSYDPMVSALLKAKEALRGYEGEQAVIEDINKALALAGLK